jgi:DNA-binding winged helix-turn-helix (wHTH) protein
MIPYSRADSVNALPERFVATIVVASDDVELTVSATREASKAYSLRGAIVLDFAASTERYRRFSQWAEYVLDATMAFPILWYLLKDVTRIDAKRSSERRVALDAEPVGSVAIPSGGIIDFGRGRFSRGDSSVSLTARELCLLEVLVRAKSATVSVTQLIEEVWGAEAITGRTAVAQLIHRLRNKLELAPGDPRILITRHGLGFALQLSESDQPKLAAR